MAKKRSTLAKFFEVALGCTNPMFPPSSISRRHAELKWVDEKLQIIDLNSSNGTFVDGEKLHPFDVNNPPTPVILHHGSKLKLGNLEMKIQESSML